MDLGLRTFQFALPGWGAAERQRAEHVLPRGRRADSRRRSSSTTTCSAPAAFSARRSTPVSPREYPNFVGAKNGTSNIVMLHDLLTQAPAIRQFYTELGYPQGCLVGEPGYLMSLTTMNPWLGVRFFEAGVARRPGDTLFGIQAESLELFELLVDSGGAEVGSRGVPGREAAHGRRVREGPRQGPRPGDAAPPPAAVPVGDRRRVRGVRRGGCRERLPHWMPQPTA